MLHRVRALVHVHQLYQQREVVVQRRGGEPLRHLRVRGAVLFADAVHVGVPGTERVGGDLLDRAGDRGGEQQGLPLSRYEREDLIDGRLEPHLQELIRLVQDQHLEVGALGHQAAGLEVVDEPPGGGDEEIAPLTAHAVALGLDVGAAEHDLRLEIVKLEHFNRLLVDLRCELARRGDYQARDVALTSGGRSK